MIINELVSCPTKLDNLYFGNNEQASFAFTAEFCFAHARIDQGRVLYEIQANQSNSSLLNIKSTWIINKKGNVQFLLWKQQTLWLFNIEKNMSVGKKKKNPRRWWKFISVRFWLTLKSYSCFKKNLFMANLLPNRLYENVNDMFLKVDYMYSLLSKSPWK